MNDSLKKPTPRSKLRGIYGFLPFGTGRRPTRCFLGTLQRAAGNDQVQWAFAEDYVGFKNGPRSMLLGGCEIGRGDFHLTAKLAVDHEGVVPTMVAGARGIAGFQARRISYAARPVRQLRHLAMPAEGFTMDDAFRCEPFGTAGATGPIGFAL